MNFIKNIASSTIGSIIGMLIAGTILIFIFVGALVGGIFGAISEMEDAESEVYSGDANVIVMNLSSNIVERGGEVPFALNFASLTPDPQIGLDQILDGLARAAIDDNIKGLYLNVSGVSAMPSTIEDIRHGIEKFRESGKWVVAWSETMSQTGYYLNSVADEVYLHPAGGMTLLGLRAQSMFYPGLLDKLGIDVTVLRGPNNEYKSAVEPLLRKNYSESNKEQLGALLGEFWTTISSSIAESRGLSTSDLDAIAEDIGVRLPLDAVELGLIDAVFYEDELEALLESNLDSLELETISFGEYALPENMFGMSMSEENLADLVSTLSDDDSEESDTEELGGEIAVIYAVGAIESGDGDAETIGSATTAAAIKAARLAPDVKAVVLRVNSPGGSALASDVIWRETILLKEAGKTLVVSMGDLAASGGYYISCAADKIYANPTTITGSIGVFGIIPNLGGMYEKHLGVTFDEIATHSHAGKPDGVFAMSDFEIHAYNEIITGIYSDFTSKVAQGRNLTAAQVEEIARGRVWSGNDALEIGLVDEIGNLEDAINFVEELINIPDAKLIYLPEILDPLEALIKDLTGVRAGFDALGFVAGDNTTINEIISVKRMVESKDIYQTRLPFSLLFIE
ncbi:MAG: signal peptide peptidase SppA [Bacteroidetes bacterium]|nr:signal peptide peptidase SppA [Bacteroidota bacterium]MDA0980258.1 signal peptide peptidase SppA [Bacteroidota bacterium]